MTKTPATNKQQLQTRVIVSNYKQLNTILIMRKTYPLLSDKTITTNGTKKSHNNRERSRSTTAKKR